MAFIFNLVLFVFLHSFISKCQRFSALNQRVSKDRWWRGRADVRSVLPVDEARVPFIPLQLCFPRCLLVCTVLYAIILSPVLYYSS